MICKEILEKLASCSPAQYAEDYDNVGLLVGRDDRNIQKVMIALDASEKVIRQAVEAKADLLVTHHPIIFHSLFHVTNQDAAGRKLLTLIENHIGCYAMHTNFDVSDMADLSAKTIGLKNPEVLMPAAVTEEGKQEGIGRIGEMPEKMKLANLAQYVKEKFLLQTVTVCGDEEKILRRAAISTGSGKSMVTHALSKRADVLITGDIDYHTAMEAAEEGLSIIDAGHFGTEIMFSGYMASYLKKSFPKLEVICAKEVSPFHVLT